MSKLVLNFKYLSLLSFFDYGQVLQFGAHSKYYKGALTKKRSFLVICTTFRSDFVSPEKIKTNVQHEIHIRCSV